MDRKEKILAYISSEAYLPLKADELIRVLDVPNNDIKKFYSLLDELLCEGKILETKKGRYIAISNDSRYVSGVLSCNPSRGFGFVKQNNDEDDIFIPPDAFNTAYDKDTVLVYIDKNNGDNSHREGHIVKILKRGNEKIVGVVKGIRNGKFIIVPDRKEFMAEIYVHQDNMMGAKKGERVLLKIEKYTDKGNPIGSVISVLGNHESILSLLNGLMLQKGLAPHFSDLVEAEASKIEDFVTEIEPDRVDLRNLTVFTIDGDDSRDFDDAISLENTDDGFWCLGVHIADVTHYVREGSQIDLEASRRGTSVYFPHSVVPMLPQKLSNGICSLNPDVDRLALSVLIELDSSLSVRSHKLVKSVIHSKYRMTYNEVNKIFDNDKSLLEKYSDIVSTLNQMNSLSKKLIEKRKARGAIDFDFPETKIICDDEANPIEILSVTRGDSQRMIESFMLLANETIAEMAFWSELPFVYRVHEAPSNEKLTEFNQFIKNFGYSLKGKPDSETIHPKALQEIAEAVKGTPYEIMISKIMLRSLMKASYRDTNDGHFGLAARFYCHFTSPIRRYPDLIIHRVLKEFISGELTDERREHYLKLMNDAAATSSECEIEAETAERDAVDMLKAAYMREHIGEVFDATVSSVTSFGIFAMLENSCEGLIRYENISEDFFVYDEVSHTAYGERGGRTFKIGDKLRVIVASSDILSKRIEFALETDDLSYITKRLHKRNIIIKTPVKDKSKFRKKNYKRR